MNTYLPSSRFGRNELGEWSISLQFLNFLKSRLDSRQLDYLDTTQLGDSTYFTAILTSPKSVMVYKYETVADNSQTSTLR